MTQVALVFLFFSLFLALFAFGILLVFHTYLLMRRKKMERFKNKWDPILTDAAIGSIAEVLPAISSQEKYNLMILWNSWQERLRGKANETLNLFAHKLGLNQVALQELNKKRGHRYWNAIITVGYLKNREAISFLMPLLENPNRVLSLLAARSLMQIDPEQGLCAIAPLLKKRQDWSFPRIAMLLEQANAQQLSKYVDPVILEQFRWNTIT